MCGGPSQESGGGQDETPQASGDVSYCIRAYNPGGTSACSNTIYVEVYCPHGQQGGTPARPAQDPDPAGDVAAAPNSLVAAPAASAPAPDNAVPDPAAAPQAAALNTLPSGQTWRSYYFFNGQRVAMREVDASGERVLYLVGDHLSSTSLVLDASGTKVAESRYYPYGEERWSSGTLPTDYRFTGTRQEAALGLYHMGARFYDPSLARWLSADTLVPGSAASSGGGAATLGYDDQVRLTPLTVGFHETQFLAVVGEENREIAAKGFWFQRSEEEKSQSKYQWGPLNPQSLNRYAYCIGNPLRYVDPTGHDPLEIWIDREMVENLILLLQDISASQSRWLGFGAVAGEAAFAGGGAIFGELAGLSAWATGLIGALAPIAAWVMMGGWDADNLDQLAIELQLLLQQNPDVFGFWMVFHGDYHGWVMWIEILGPNHDAVQGYWKENWWGLSSIVAQSGFLQALGRLHNEWEYNFTYEGSQFQSKNDLYILHRRFLDNDSMFAGGV